MGALTTLVIAVAMQAPAVDQPAQCAPDQLRRDTMELTVYAFVPPRKPRESADEYRAREDQANAVIQLIDSIPVISLPAFVGTALFPDNIDSYSLPDLDGEVWFQVDGGGRLRALKLTQPTGSPELNRALLRAAVKADSLRLLPALPSKLRDKAIDMRITLQTAKPEGPAVAIARATISFVPIHSGVELLPGYRPPSMPRNAWSYGTGDTVLIDVVIDAAGVPDMTTLGFRRVGWRDFAEEVRQSLATMRFKPATSGNCRVPQRICQPWHFVFK